MHRAVTRRLLLVSIRVLAVLVGLVLLFRIGYHITSEEAAFTRTFEKVSVGSDEREVIALLGKPDDTGEDFRLGQRDGYEEAYQRASTSNAKYYWFWFRGTDIVYAIGFDEQKRVVITEYGGT